MTIAAHCLVKNESRFVWYAVMSVVGVVDKVLLWDTGSTDGTREVIERIRELEISKKINFREVGDVSPEEFTKVRQEMLEATDTDWFIVVDGDEIWWEDSIKKVVQIVKGSTGRNIESIVVPTINLVGDIYHYQEEVAGQYQLAGRRGHLNLRAVNRKIPGLCSKGEHGVWGWADEKGRMIQDRDPEKIKFVDAPYLHATHLPRGAARSADFAVPKRKQKLKHELGIKFPRDFYYPEVFFRPKPKIVPSPWEKMSASFKIRAGLETPLKRIKRRVLPSKIGY